MRRQGAEGTSLYTPAGRRKYLTQAERARFIAAASTCPRADVRTLCLTLAYTGCRISEALALTHAAIDAQSGFIAFQSLKKRRRLMVIREVPAPDGLLSILCHDRPVCDGEPGERIWMLSRSRAWQLVKAVMADAGIAPGIHATPKGLRHGFGIHAIHSGVPINLVQRWLGHARLETTAIYLQAMGSEEREIAARMWATSEARP